MTTQECNERLKKVKNLYDFQEEFYFENVVTGEMIPDFELVYKVGNSYNHSAAAAIYNKNGRCINEYIVCSDGYVEDPF